MASGGDLREEVRQLRTLLGITLISCLVITVSVGVYVSKQVAQLRREVNGRMDTMAQIPEENRKMSAFIVQLKQFGRTYPDFAEVLKKYDLKDDQAASAPAPVSAPPAGAPAAKK
jgi:hypothetical protein